MYLETNQQGLWGWCLRVLEVWEVYYAKRGEA